MPQQKLCQVRDSNYLALELLEHVGVITQCFIAPFRSVSQFIKLMTASKDGDVSVINATINGNVVTARGLNVDQVSLFESRRMRFYGLARTLVL